MAFEDLTRNKIECPFAIKWTIAEAKLVALKDSNNGFLETEKFEASNIPGVKYYLSIYPNGAAFKFIIDSAGFFKEDNYEYDRSIGFGTTFCSIEELFNPEKKFIIDGKLTVKCEGILWIEKENGTRKRKWKDTSLGHHLWEDKTKDFTITINENTIHAHKNVLSARSPVFKGMFDSGMIEAAENKMEISDFTYEIVEAAIELLYDRKIPSITVEEKISVLQFFDKYQILDLKDAIEASLIEEISVSTVCHLANCSIFSNASNLERKCLDFLIDCNNKKHLVCDVDDLDKDFAFKVFQNSFCNITQT